MVRNHTYIYIYIDSIDYNEMDQLWVTTWQAITFLCPNMGMI